MLGSLRDLQAEEQCEMNIDDMIKKIVQTVLGSVEEPYKAGLDETCLSIFENSIADVVSMSFVMQ